MQCAKLRKCKEQLFPFIVYTIVPFIVYTIVLVSNIKSNFRFTISNAISSVLIRSLLPRSEDDIDDDDDDENGLSLVSLDALSKAASISDDEEESSRSSC